MSLFLAVFVIAVAYIVYRRTTPPPRQEPPDDEPDKW
jgi:hypothetical protein